MRSEKVSAVFSDGYRHTCLASRCWDTFPHDLLDLAVVEQEQLGECDLAQRQMTSDLVARSSTAVPMEGFVAASSSSTPSSVPSSDNDDTGTDTDMDEVTSLIARPAARALTRTQTVSLIYLSLFIAN